jgi:hypothetical protein
MDRKEIREIAEEIRKERECLNMKLKFLNKKQLRLEIECDHPNKKTKYWLSGSCISCCDCGWKEETR